MKIFLLIGSIALVGLVNCGENRNNAGLVNPGMSMQLNKEVSSRNIGRVNLEVGKVFGDEAARYCKDIAKNMRACNVAKRMDRQPCCWDTSRESGTCTVCASARTPVGLCDRFSHSRAVCIKAKRPDGPKCCFQQETEKCRGC